MIDYISLFMLMHEKTTYLIQCDTVLFSLSLCFIYSVFDTIIVRAMRVQDLIFPRALTPTALLI